MPTQTKSWTDITRRRFEACGARKYLQDVADGTVKPDPVRVRACEFIINKVLPSPPLSVVKHDSDQVPDFYVNHPPAD